VIPDIRLSSHCAILITLYFQSMDPKFIAVLLVVECAALIFNIFHLIPKHFDSYTNYDESPKKFNISNVNYECFTSIRLCHYDNKKLMKFNVPHSIFIVFSILGYAALIYVIRKGKDHHFYGSQFSVYNTIRLLVLLMTCFNTLLLIFYYMDDEEMIKSCGRITYMTRIENLSTYIIINVLEVAYLCLDFMQHRHVPYYEHSLSSNAGEGQRLLAQVQTIEG
jgi:hypothetical protein